MRTPILFSRRRNLHTGRSISELPYRQFVNDLAIKVMAATLAFFLGVLSSEADTFTINGRKITIPVPEGFARVTEEMSLVMALVQQVDTADTSNETLAYYIEKTDVPAALAGEAPDLDRTLNLAIIKELKNVTVGKSYFSKFKTVVKRENEKIHKDTVAQRAPELTKQFSEGVSKDFNVDFSVGISAMVPLAPHHETENAISSSTYISDSGSVNGETSASTAVNTQTLVNIGGTVLTLNCDAPRPEVEWSREASMKWLESVLASNTLLLNHSNGFWRRLSEGGSGVGLAVLMAAGAYWVIRKKSNKSRQNP